MRSLLLFLLLVVCEVLSAQLASPPTIDLGLIPSAYEIKGFTVLENKGVSKVFLMRADAEPGVRVYASKKNAAPW